MALVKMKQKKRNRYVWRLDFSLLGEDNYNSEIGREVRKHPLLWKIALGIGISGCGLFIILFIVLLLYHANLTYIELSGITALILSLMWGTIFKIPKITESDVKKIEDEMNMESGRIEELDVLFTENALIMQRGILVYRIPYLEIAGIRARHLRGKMAPRRVQYRLRDGRKIGIDYIGLGMYPFDKPPFAALWEQLLKYNPKIMIELFEHRRF